VNKDKDDSSLELMLKDRANELKRARKFGEICVAVTKAKIKGKLSDRRREEERMV
jgi:hypothetical protein